MKEMTLTIQGMTCHHCVMAVRKELTKLPGTEVRDVQIGSARLAVDETKVTPALIEAAVQEAGFILVG
jgi:copper chaperone